MKHLEFALDLAQKAGAIIRKNFQENDKQTTMKSNDTFLTKTDTDVNKLVLDEAKRLYPGYGVIGEEGSNFSGQDDVWVVDPMDGTIAFLAGMPTFVFGLAYVHLGEPLMGVVYAPLLDHLYYAEVGQGAFVTNQNRQTPKPMKVSALAILKGGIVNIENQMRSELNGIYSKLRPEVMVTGYSSSLHAGCLVAKGGLIASVSLDCFGAWDSAPLMVIVKEAGGCFTDLNGEAPLLNGDTFGHIVSNGLVHDELLDKIQGLLK